MNSDMELRRRTWIAALRLAFLISVLAASSAIAISATGDVPQAAVVLPVIVVAFTASWIQTGRIRRDESPVRVTMTQRRTTAPTA
jgi:hypothetical protein